MTSALMEHHAQFSASADGSWDRSQCAHRRRGVAHEPSRLQFSSEHHHLTLRLPPHRKADTAHEHRARTQRPGRRTALFETLRSRNPTARAFSVSNVRPFLVAQGATKRCLSPFLALQPGLHAGFLPLLHLPGHLVAWKRQSWPVALPLKQGRPSCRRPGPPKSRVWRSRHPLPPHPWRSTSC